jgi:hypothetical protein
LVGFVKLLFVLIKRGLLTVWVMLNGASDVFVKHIKIKIKHKIQGRTRGIPGSIPGGTTLG